MPPLLFEQAPWINLNVAAVLSRLRGSISSIPGRALRGRRLVVLKRFPWVD